MNEILWFLFALVNFILVVLIYKVFGKTGLFAWIAMGTVVANIQVTKSIELFGLEATLGNIMYGTLFLVTDTLNEKYGPKEARRAVYIGFFTLISTVIIMQIALRFEPIGEGVIIHEAMEQIFGIMPLIALGSLTAYIVSQLFDVYVFQRIKKAWPSDRALYVRNLGSTMLSQLLDTIIFVPIALSTLYSFPVLVNIFITTYLIKVIVAALDTPFVYLMKKIRPVSR